MNEIVTLIDNTDIDLWLGEVAQKIQGHLGKAAFELYQAGYWLGQARDKIEKGTWDDWVRENFPFSPETARRFVRVTNMIDHYITEGLISRENLSKLLVSKSALYELASSETPEEARFELMARLEQGQRVTISMVKGAAAAAERSEQQRDAVLDAGSERIGFLAEEYDLDPSVIPMLSDLETTEPDTFEEIYLSGCIWDATGESVGLDEANGRDIQAYVDHTRFERKASSLAKTGALKLTMPEVRPPTNAEIWGSYGLKQRSKAEVCHQQVQKAIDAIVDLLVAPYDVPVELVYTLYVLRRTPRVSEIYTRGYEEGLYHAGLIQGDGPLFINSMKVRSRTVKQNPRFEIDIYPLREE
jgi:hypothetical protein